VASYLPECPFFFFSVIDFGWVAAASTHVQPIPQQSRYTVSLGRDMPIGEAEDVVAEATQGEIAVAIFLECNRPPVVPIAVGFDNKAPARPEEVNRQPPDSCVDLRYRQVVPAAKAEKVPLQIAPRPIRFNAGTE
jgi:hypothetical protein